MLDFCKIGLKIARCFHNKHIFPENCSFAKKKKKHTTKNSNDSIMNASCMKTHRYSISCMFGISKSRSTCGMVFWSLPHTVPWQISTRKFAQSIKPKISFWCLEQGAGLSISLVWFWSNVPPCTQEAPWIPKDSLGMTRVMSWPLQAVGSSASMQRSPDSRENSY